jgi:membrane protease YdiL (CAAX protease family)
MMLPIAAYLIAIAVVELVGVYVGVVPSLIGHAILIVVLLGQYALQNQAPYRRILPVLALASLLRILSFSMPVKEVPQIYWYAMIGIPFLVAVALTARLLDFSWVKHGLRLPSRSAQVLVALSGLPLSIVAYLILRPKPLVAGPQWGGIIVAVVMLFLFTGLSEEIFFRGMLLGTATELSGRRNGVLYSSALFAIMYIGSLSLSFVLFAGVVGVFFSWCVSRTGSIWGVVLAHAAISIGMLLVWPVVWR